MITICPKTAETPEFLKGQGIAGRCEICTGAAASFRKIENTLEQLIKYDMEFPCRFFWPFASQCTSVVDTIIVSVFDRLHTLFDGYEDEDICKLAHFCSAAPGELAALSHTSLCDVCVDSLEEVKFVVTSPIVEHLAVDIVKFGCSLIPSRDLAGQCKQAYSFFVTEVFWGTRDFLTNFTPKDFCDYIYLCATDKREASEFLALVTAPKDEPVTLCDICEDSIAVVRFLSMSEELERMVKTNTKWSCIFAGPFRGYCENQVESIVTFAFGKARNIIANVDDHTVCYTINFCQEGNKTSLCDVCKSSYVVSKEFLVSGRLHDFVETSTQFGCRAFGPLRIICEKVVLGVTDKFFSVIHEDMDGVNGQDFCANLYMCSSKSEFYAAVGLDKSNLCDVCQHAINTLEENILDISENLERIAANMGKITCKAFSGSYRTKCEKMVEEAAHSSFNIIKNALDIYTSAELCQAFHVC